ncbi:sterol desaturase family protein [Dermatobacter hominis]|uniref:sterol desaturase family protein n=1 Tax=Dermatobacter hominis TaxID=2884263 RepID=UPI001D107369|nr:sterol desaturase family protein [Dermatobacter hominis]UDY35354.1 sterol desaturase family protein [Dermatobacter hominis]
MDLTVAAIPFYFGSMGLEAAVQKRRRDRGAPPSAGDYERNDTLVSLGMGVASLIVPAITVPLFRRFDVGDGRYRRVVLGVAGGAAVAAVAADAIARAQELEAGRVPEPGAADERATPEPEAGSTGRGNRAARRARSVWRRVAGSAAMTAIAAGGAAVAGTWAGRTTAKRLFEHRLVPDLGSGPAATAAAILAWDLIYYWNHRFMHSSRYLWAVHVVHHSSERYNLSTALRQPVADSLGTFVPYGLMSLLGIRPELIETARGVNLIYQFWIHTEVVPKLGPFEQVFNTASHHRVHHGSNRQYLDRNHGSILIVWDRLFGTFEVEDERVVYGLTKNIETFDPVKVMTHEYVDIARDVAGSDTWSDRLSFVFRGPGWAYERHRELATVDEHLSEEAAPIAG